MSSHFALLIFFMYLLSSGLTCEKDRPEDNKLPAVLPPATTIGANTFGCEINGVVWNATELNADYWNGDFVIHPKRKVPFIAVEDLAIQTIKEFFDTGNYELIYFAPIPMME
ncbi:MAG: hypothetical protein K1X81_08385 [Bacteroidia bacterium]|nr:hypothetical protein [Bacteroidia bacterium]